MSALRHRRRLLALRCVAGFVLALLGLGVLLGALHHGHEPAGVLGGPRHALVVALSALLVLARAQRLARDRAAWLALGSGAAVYAIGLAGWQLFFSERASSPADSLFVVGDLLFWAGLVLYLRRRVGDALPTFWIDAAGLALAAGSVFTALLLARARAASGLPTLNAASVVSWPAADLGLASIPLVVSSFSGRSRRPQDRLLIACFATAFVADSCWALSLAGLVPTYGCWLDLGWELQMVLLATAAWARPSAAGTLRVGGWWESGPTAALVVAGAGVLVAGATTGLPTVTIVLAVLTIAAGVARGALLTRDVRRLVVQRAEELTDDITQLPNRRALFRELELLSRDRGRSGERADLLVIDLDGFRELNETLGHDAGDALLAAVAERLGPVVGRDLLVRLGADDFAAVVRLAGPGDGEQTAQALRDALAAPIEIGDVAVALEASIGIARFPDDARDAGELARRAEVATSDAKRRRVGIARYAADRDDHSRERLDLAADLRAALVAPDGGGLWVAFQPQVAPEGGPVESAEALIRWRHPVRGDISPAELLPVAERTGQMSALTDWVLDRTLEQSAALRADGLEIRLAVNVSAVTLVDVALPDRVAAALARHGIAPGSLVVEVTEDAVMSDQRRCLDVVERLAQLGVGISIDDFGTGQSSLAQLRHLPADELKIDRTFVQGMAADRLDAELVQLVVAMGRRLGLRVVAEGIETGVERAALARLGCDLVQGFGIGRPMPAGELAAFVAARAGDADAERRAA